MKTVSQSLILLLFFTFAFFSPLAQAGQASDQAQYFRNNLDYLRSQQSFLNDLLLLKVRTPPEEFNDPALTKVTREFGNSVIPMNKLPMRSGMATATNPVWSSYWFPAYEKDLFETDAGSGNSPLEKYDLVRSYLKGSSKAAKIESDRYARTVPALWDGLCDAWSTAAVLMPEPATPITVKVNGNRIVTFSVSDQKALLFKSFEGLPAKALQIYGQKFTGASAKTEDGLSYGWIQPDIFPEQFHRFIEVALFQKKQSFVMDHDPGEAVWSEPVHKANYEITAVRGRNDVVMVTMYLYPAKQLKKEEKDSPGLNQTTRTYQYLLFGTNDGYGNLNVDYGVWLSQDWLARSADFKNDTALLKAVSVDSRADHPDYLFLAPDSARAARQPFNPEIDPKIVDDIIKGNIK